MYSTSLLRHTPAFVRHAAKMLNTRQGLQQQILGAPPAEAGLSAVLLPIAESSTVNGAGKGPCLLFNKRSAHIRQPGDLCFPGGSVSCPTDRLLAKVLALPLLPLARWRAWSRLRRKDPAAARRIAIGVATGLRESFEEMHLNPFGVRVIAALPLEKLIMFRRSIFPVAVWISRQRRFFPNSEVEKIICVPLARFLNPQHYLRYRVRYAHLPAEKRARRTEDFPCFRLQTGDGSELLWGATYRITMAFLKAVLGFEPPPPASRPVVIRSLDRAYLTGPGRSLRKKKASPPLRRGGTYR